MDAAFQLVDGPKQNSALVRWSKEKTSLKGSINHELGCHGCQGCAFPNSIHTKPYFSILCNRFHAGAEYRIIPDAKTKGKSIGLCHRLYSQAWPVSPLPL